MDTLDVKKLTILVIEDNDVANFCYQMMMAGRSNIEAHFAQSGAETFEVLESLLRPVDLIFLDRGLPDLDGLLLAKMLREKGIRCPILVVSANNIPLFEKEMYSSIIQAFYKKPLLSVKFDQILSHYLS